MALSITDVKVFLTMPSQKADCRLVVVKVLTSEPGLYGLGCATFTQRHLAVKAAIEGHIGPLAIGKDPSNIEDFWHSAMVNGYWRNGPVLNNAISGVDMALWDIKGKVAGLPCYQLWGGKCRGGAAAYSHADGSSPEQVIESVRRLMSEGYKTVRIQMGGYNGRRQGPVVRAEGALEGVYFAPREKLSAIPVMFEAVRKELGDEIELIHDVHERLAPIDAIWLAKAIEPYRPFFLEDPLAPEDGAWLAQLRAQSATPIALGELFNHPLEMIPLIANRQIDFVRCHLSQLGGITPALKLAHLCEAFGVRTAWHGPGDVSPIGVAANIHLDLAMHNFGIQEWTAQSEVEQAMFPGMPEYRDGYIYANDRPGLGIDFDEQMAVKYPCDDDNPMWTVLRTADGTIVRP